MKISVEEMRQKVATLRQITGGKPFSTKDLPEAVLQQLNYKNSHCFSVLLHRLTKGSANCGHQLVRIGKGKYDWVSSPVKEDVVKSEKSASPPHVAKDLTLDEKMALDIVHELLVRTPNGVIRLAPNMLALNREEFLGFVGKLASVNAVLPLGANGHATGGHVWGVARNKFNDFYQVAQAVRLGQYEFPPEEPSTTSPSELPVVPASVTVTKAVKKLSASVEKQLSSICKLAEAEIVQCDQEMKNLEAKLAQVREARAEAVRRFNLFRQEWHRLDSK